MKVHTEETFEALIEAHLVEQGGYESGSPDAYDRDRALLPETVLAFVQDTQPKVWAKLQAIHKGKLDTLFLDALCKVMDQRGSLEVLRHGFKFYDKRVRLAYFEPGNNLNPAVWELCGKNRLTVVRQVRYDPKNDNELDLVLFLNGLPVATAELKNPVTGQKVGHAKKQYREDRDPAAPIFRWKHEGKRALLPQRALVHFAVDTDEVWMSTRLAGVSTWFLPFNKGEKVYDAVVVLTDRRVLDQQLQNTIGQFEHKAGVVELIDKRSDQLAEALQSGATFRRVPLEEVKPFENCLPALDLKVAAGTFTAAHVEDDMPQRDGLEELGRYDWVAIDGRTKPAPGVFVAQVIGESMNRRIPNGAWCVWRIEPAGTRQGKVVLAQHADIHDPEHGGSYTVKIYESEKEPTDDGGWRHRRIILKPDSTDPAFEPIVLEHLEEGALTIVAELVEVL